MSAADPDLDPRSDRAKASHKLLLRVLRRLREDYEPWGKDPRDDMARTCADCSCGCVFFNQLSGQLGADWGVCMNPESHRAGLLTWEHQGCHHFRFDEALESDQIEPCGCEESEALRAQLTEAVEWVEYLAWDQPTPIEEARAWLKVPFRVPAHPAAPEPSADIDTSDWRVPPRSAEVTLADVAKLAREVLASNNAECLDALDLCEQLERVLLGYPALTPAPSPGAEQEGGK